LSDALHGADMAGGHLLKGLIRDGDSFPDRVEELTVALAKRLRMPRRRINYGLSGLARVERAVRRLYPPARRDAPELLLPLVAYVSEVGRRQVRGRWQMRLSEDGKIWEPWIIGRDGNEFEFFTVAYKEFCNQPDESASIVGALIGTIRAPVLDGMIEPAEVNVIEQFQQLYSSALGTNKVRRTKQQQQKRGRRR
jgi:hypothetical protein